MAVDRSAGSWKVWLSAEKCFFDVRSRVKLGNPLKHSFGLGQVHPLQQEFSPPTGIEVHGFDAKANFESKLVWSAIVAPFYAFKRRVSLP